MPDGGYISPVYRTDTLRPHALRSSEPSRHPPEHVRPLPLVTRRTCPPGTDQDFNGLCDILDLTPLARRLLRQPLATPAPLHPDTDRDGTPDTRDIDDDNDRTPDVRDPSPREAVIRKRRHSPPARIWDTRQVTHERLLYSTARNAYRPGNTWTGVCASEWLG